MRSTDPRLAWLEHKKIGLISGGPSNERDVSKRSAKNVAKALAELGLKFVELDPSTEEFFTTPFDIAFNCLHGKWGEDGILQGYCESKGIAYTGPGLKATIAGYDKPMFKQVLNGLGILTPQLLEVPNQYPLIAKPKTDGSSIGIHLIKSKTEFDNVALLDDRIKSKQYFYEEYINGTEITSGVIRVNEEILVLPILEIQSKNEFYDLDAKYTPGKTTFILPASISSELELKVSKISRQIYENFDCKGCIRIDMMIRDNSPYVLEMNTNPGLTELSDIPAQARHAGIDFNELMIHYLESAK